MLRSLPLFLATVAIAACAQPAPSSDDRLRFRQPVGEGYEVQIRMAPIAECEDDEPTFGFLDEPSVFERVTPSADPCEGPAETLSLWHEGTLVDEVGAHRFWLGAAPDTLMWEGLAPEDHPVPEGAVQDLTGDGTPELLVSAWSGGAHCCTSLLIVSLGEEPRQIGLVEATHSEIEVRDDGDGPSAIWLYDFAFAYWNTSFAGSPAPQVALVWDGERFALAPDRMQQPPLEPEAFDALVARVRTDDAWKRAEPFPPVLYWETLLDLLYTGRGAQAAQFAEAAWVGDSLGRAVFLRWFRDGLWTSPWGEAIVDLNREAVDWL